MQDEYWFEFAGKRRSASIYGTDFLPELRRIAEGHLTRPGQQILEWGAGLSTLLLADIAPLRKAELVSVDNNADYQKAVCDRVPIGSLVKAYTVDLTGPRKSDSDPGPNYSTFPLGRREEFDLILIDGDGGWDARWSPLSYAEVTPSYYCMITGGGDIRSSLRCSISSKMAINSG